MNDHNDPRRGDERAPNEGPGGQEGVPETWRGYLGEETTGSANRGKAGRDRSGRHQDDGVLTDEEREWLRHSLESDGKESGASARQPAAGDGPRYARDGRPLDERGVPVSRAEGMSTSGLIPFVLMILAAIMIAGYFIWATADPGEYSVDGFGPPDKTAAVITRDMFAGMVGGQGAPELFVDDLTLVGIGEKERGAPFGVSLAARHAMAERLSRDGTFKANDPEPQVENEYLEYIDYEWTDLTTAQVTDVRLWLGRVEDGWRVIGFQQR